MYCCALQINIGQAPAASVSIRGDGNCFWRSIAWFIFGDQEQHAVIRQLVTVHVNVSVSMCNCCASAHGLIGCVCSLQVVRFMANEIHGERSFRRGEQLTLKEGERVMPVDWAEYLDYQRFDGTWATVTEILATVRALRTPIFTYYEVGDWRWNGYNFANLQLS
jgi:hypothetical protein